MPTLTNVRAIALGSHRDLDNNEFQLGAERAGELVGTTFGSADNPLARNIFSSTLRDGNDNGSIAFNGPNGSPAGEYASIDGTAHYLDSGVLYTGSITYMDGTTATGIPLRVLQDTSGNLVLVPPPSGASTLEISALTTRPIQSITLNGVLQNNFGSLNSSRYGLQDAPTFICFRNGTLILTERGNVAVEDLRPGDMVITRDHGPQPLRWIGSKQIDETLLQAFDTLRPVRIRAGVLGRNLPERDLYVSQQHRILIDSKIAQRMFGTPEILVAAKHLTGIEGIEIDDSRESLDYFHLLFDRHEIICSEGAQTESLFTGPEALKSVDPAARAEIMALFPELLAADDAPEPARPIGTGRVGRQLAKRHSQNRHELQMAQMR
ncbi:Hint domain-containing protein [Paracoccus lutimaris]|uniref:Hint domain-containing protein n=1 Tax=Paracoccus lutimaris TaxID=1490030 RepID=A0A368YZG2_9RHOB|nr:Hint domain-containing protein [Paracoccus lutimaris]RCW85059.1 Hint domain-containing protein [Paracoccus lutimaris]